MLLVFKSKEIIELVSSFPDWLLFVDQLFHQLDLPLCLLRILNALRTLPIFRLYFLQQILELRMIALFEDLFDGVGVGLEVD